MPALAETLALAVQHHQQGGLHQAEELYRQILQVDPDHADAWHLLGLIAHQTGRTAEAVVMIRRALQLQPSFADAHYNLGLVLLAQGRLEEAAASCRQALQLRPDYAEAHANLGNILKQVGRLDEALDSYQRALWVRPGYAEVHNNRANVLKDQGRLDEAAAAYEQALRLQPAFAEAHNNLGAVFEQQGKLAEAAACFREAIRLKPDLAEAHANLGKVVQGQSNQLPPLGETQDAGPAHAAVTERGIHLASAGRLEEAAACFRQAIRLQPASAAAHNNLANVLRHQGRLAEAAASCQEAIRLQPDLVEALLNRAMILKEQNQLEEALVQGRQAIQLRPSSAEAHTTVGDILMALDRLEEALASCRQAIELQPHFVEGHNTLGVALYAMGRLAEAMACYRQAIELQPDYAEAHQNLAFALLLSGDLEQGWAEYEWRWRCKEAGRPTFPQPRWDGSALAGRTIVLFPEQGLGDTLQFARYAPLVKACGGTVFLGCQPPLLRLLSNCPGVDRVLLQDTPLPDFDVHAPLLSLPRLFGTTLSNVPPPLAALRPAPEVVAPWQRRFAGDGFRVGIAWQGSPQHRGDRKRSVPLGQFAPLAQVPGVRLISLQQGHGSEQRAAAPFPLEGPDAPLQDVAEAAALVACLDLVVCVDTALAHLAGTIGVPVWLALPFAPDWRWLLGRADSPWYPGMRLFRQPRPGAWEPVFVELARALAAMVE
jgi:tetratricopeptide (TPR) repeat protein